MKIIFSIICLVFAVNSYCQIDSTAKISNLSNTKNAIKKASFQRTTWSLYAIYNEKKYAPIRSENVINDINQYLTIMDTSQSKNIYEIAEIKKYLPNIDSTFKTLTLFGPGQLAEFLYTKPYSIPVNFSLTGDTALTMLISGICIDNIYNTLKLTSRQRATKVITTFLIPQLRVFSKCFPNTDIKYFGFAAVFGSKDFSSTSKTSTKAEFVSFVVPTGIINKFVSGDITEDELVESSEVNISDRDMIVDVKKIKLVLE
jgi:hypothetical protein